MKIDFYRINFESWWGEDLTQKIAQNQLNCGSKFLLIEFSLLKSEWGCPSVHSISPKHFYSPTTTLFKHHRMWEASKNLQTESLSKLHFILPIFQFPFCFRHQFKHKKNRKKSFLYWGSDGRFSVLSISQISLMKFHCLSFSCFVERISFFVHLIICRSVL